MLNDHGVNPWYFREANRAGDEWKKKLTKVIDLTSSHVIVVGEEIGMVQKEEIALIENKSKYDQNLRIFSLILTKPDESNN